MKTIVYLRMYMRMYICKYKPTYIRCHLEKMWQHLLHSAHIALILTLDSSLKTNLTQDEARFDKNYPC